MYRRAVKESGGMKTKVKALIVGGGAVGTSIAYHLGKRGWDTLLIERDELTSGSTWHAAGLLPLFNMSYATTHIHKYSVDFYKSLEAETGLNAGFAVVGNLRMAQTEERMDEYKLYASTAETCGVPYNFMTPEEIKKKYGSLFNEANDQEIKIPIPSVSDKPDSEVAKPVLTHIITLSLIHI